MSGERARRQVERAVFPRLSSHDGARLFALAIICLLTLVPGLLRLLPDESEIGPHVQCREGSVWVVDHVECQTGAEDLDPAQRLWLGQRMDLNRIDAEALTIVPGIGASLAERITRDRAEHGRFRSLADVERVKGIGPKLRARMAPYVEVR